MSDRKLAPGYCTTAAIDGAFQRGFDLSARDWRGVFLAITDHFADDGQRSDRSDIATDYVGPLRDGMERWTITFSRRSFDALYDPFRAIVYRVASTGRPAAATSASPPPTDPPTLSVAASSVSERA